MSKNECMLDRERERMRKEADMREPKHENK